MRFLIVGAGATGGYFGGRLLEAGCDVTFLLRARRAAQLRETGLIIRSPHGDVAIADPPHTLAEGILAPFDVVVVSSKAYDLEGTIESFAPAVGPTTRILPLLNGMRHIDRLNERFGAERVLGGVCFISSTLDDEGAIVHLNDVHTLLFGQQDGVSSPELTALEAECQRAKFTARASANIMHDMWEKWVFISSLGALTSLMRAPVGDVMTAVGDSLALSLLEECSMIARQNGFGPRSEADERARKFLTTPGSPLQASMAKDIERGARIEADHIVGDLLARGTGAGTNGNDWSLLRVAYAGLKSYEARREREGAASA
jgi:2-dehydropantoate 2-reductase